MVEGFGGAKSAASTLYLNFGNEARALEFLGQKLSQGLAADIKVFPVPKSFLEELGQTAVAESEAAQFPQSPVIADPTKAANQFGLRASQIEKLEQLLRKK